MIDVDHSSHEIFNATRKCLQKKRNKGIKEMIYGNGNTSNKIVKYLEKVKLSDKLLKKQITY